MLKLLVLLTFLTSVSLWASQPLEFPHKYKLKKKSFLKHTGPENHITGIDTNRNFTDLDQDGTVDLLDEDIDGDGVSNYMDLSPLDKKVQGKDKDRDGIPDFLDFKIGSKLQEEMDIESAIFQERLFKEKGLLIFNGDAPFANREFKKLASLYLSKELRLFKKAKELDVIFKQPVSPMGYRGKYRFSHKSITLYQNNDHASNPLHQELTLIHENFHALIQSEPELWNEFLLVSGWKVEEENYFYKEESFPISLIKTNPEMIIKALQSPEFPSDYSKLGPTEMYAECATASLMNHREGIIKVKYPYLDSYLETELHSFVLSSFQTVLK